MATQEQPLVPDVLEALFAFKETTAESMCYSLLQHCPAAVSIDKMS